VPHKPPRPDDFNENPEWTEEDFAKAVRLKKPVRLADLQPEFFRSLHPDNVPEVADGMLRCAKVIEIVKRDTD
jgi:hypothetical protein